MSIFSWRSRVQPDTTEAPPSNSGIETRVTQPGIELPKRIESAIGYDEWARLSDILQNQQVQEYKWLFSQEKGDIGVPETVRRMPVFRPNTDGFYQLMIEGYLLGTDFVSSLKVKKVKPDGFYDLVKTGVVPDEHGADQLEGELRRFWARERGISQSNAISSIRITPTVLEQYCKRYNLGREVQTSLAQKLNLEAAPLA